MDISVVIPTLNRPAELQVAIRSILDQTRLPKEIIVVDQSEGIETHAVVDELKREVFGQVEIHYLFQKDRSTAKARNKGTKAAGEEIISYVDDDVTISRNYFEN